MLQLIWKLQDAWLRRMARARIERLLRNDLANEIACLQQAGELDGVLANHGLSPAAVQYLLKKYPAALYRHDAMRRRIGVSPRHFVPRMGLSALDRSRSRCLYCPAAKRCQRWLDDRKSGHAPFCPNSETFERLRSQALRPKPTGSWARSNPNRQY